jgi:cytochrome c-type biogenesis protein CcmH/NrfF
MFRRGLQAALLCIATVVIAGAGGASRYEKLGHEMVCQCGCGQILLECNHVGCPVSPVMIGELQKQLTGGGGDTSILNWFAAKYGPIVLAAPIRGGFDDVAWIAPIAVFVLATLGTGVVVLIWKKRSGPGGGAEMPSALARGGLAGDDALRERIRRETEYR